MSQRLRGARQITAAAGEGVERRPVSFAEGGKRLVRGLISRRFCRLQNDGPMRRLKRRTTLLQCSWYGLANDPIIYECSGIYDQKTRLTGTIRHGGASWPNK